MAKGPEELNELLERARRRGKAIGLHLVRGPLHGAHRANIAKMAAECQVAVVAVLPSAPISGPLGRQEACERDLRADLALAEQAGASVVFAPRPESLFPEEPVVRVTAGRLGGILEGEHLPGLLDRFATLVAKLLAIAGPCWAYFGEKDYQRLVLARRLVADLSLQAVVVPCPTVRDPDGLALSAANALLSRAERRAAPALYWALLAGKRAIDERGVRDAANVRALMREVLAREPLIAVDYTEVCEPETLEPLAEVRGEARLLVAGRVGKARLLDSLAARDPAAADLGQGASTEAGQQC